MTPSIERIVLIMSFQYNARRLFKLLLLLNLNLLQQPFWDGPLSHASNNLDLSDCEFC